MELSRDAIEHVLEDWPVARLATLRADGTAALVPVVFARSGGRLWLPIDGKPKRAGGSLARLANVARDPRVALLFDQYVADWSALWWLRVEGAAERVTPGAPGFEGGLAALLRKYPQYKETPPFRPGAAPCLLGVTPETTSSWAASPDIAEFLA